MENYTFLAVVMVGTYCYMMFMIRKTGEPGAQVGFSVNGLIAGAVAAGTGLVAFVIIHIAGLLGYLIVGVSFPPTIHRLAKWIAVKV